MSFDISNVTPRAEYTATGGQVNFSVNFEWQTDTDLVVLQNGTTKTLTTHYTLAGAGVTGGGTMTLVTPASSGDIVVIYRNQSTARVTAYTTFGSIPALTLDADMDRLTMLVQEARRDLARSIRLPTTDVGAITTTLPTKALRANGTLSFDSAGNVTTATAVAQSAVTGSFTGTATGMTIVTTGTVYYSILAGFCTLWVDAFIQGTSNTTSLSLTGAPAACIPAVNRIVLCDVQNNSQIQVGMAQVSSFTGTIQFYASSPLSSTGFTNSNQKGLNTGWIIRYPL